VLDHSSLHSLTAGDGRLLHGWLLDLVLRHAGDVADLWMPRALFVILLSTWAVVATWRLRNLGMDEAGALAMGVVWCAMPGTVDMVSPVSGFSTPLALMAAATAHALLPRIQQGHRNAWLGALLLLQVALSIYQVSAFVFVLFSAVELANTAQEPRRAWERVRVAALVFGLGLLLHLVLAFVVHPWLGGFELHGRGALTHAPLRKVAWFGGMVLRDALNLCVMFPTDAVAQLFSGQGSSVPLLEVAVVWAQQPNTWLALAVGLLVLGALWLTLPAGVDARVRRWTGLALLLALPATMALHLVVRSFWAPFRTQYVLTALVHIYLLMGLRHAALRWKGMATLRPWLLGCYCVLAVASARHIHRAYVVEPLSLEYQQLAALAPATHVQVAQPQDHCGPGIRYELGRAAGASDWAATSMVRMARLSGHLDTNVAVTVDPPAGTGPGVRLGCGKNWVVPRAPPHPRGPTTTPPPGTPPPQAR